MRDLLDVAEQLRNVKDAQERFLWRWHFEEVFVGPELLDQVAADVERLPPGLLGMLEGWDKGSEPLHFGGPMVDEP